MDYFAFEDKFILCRSGKYYTGWGQPVGLTAGRPDGEAGNRTSRALLRHRPSRPRPRASHKLGPPTFLNIYIYIYGISNKQSCQESEHQLASFSSYACNLWVAPCGRLKKVQYYQSHRLSGIVTDILSNQIRINI